MLDGQQNASLTLSTLSPGVHTILAQYAGDGRGHASTSAPVVITVKQTSSLTLISSANPAFTISPVTLTASLANAGAAVAMGSVVFSEGTAELGTAALDTSGHASISLPSLAAGTHEIVATYDGDEDDFAAISQSLTGCQPAGNHDLAFRLSDRSQQILNR